MEYRVTYTKMPTNFNETKVMFVHQETPEKALNFAREKHERQTGTAASGYVWDAKPYIKGE